MWGGRGELLGGCDTGWGRRRSSAWTAAAIAGCRRFFTYNLQIFKKGIVRFL
jgi:hypothetical protein